MATNPEVKDLETTAENNVQEAGLIGPSIFFGQKFADPGQQPGLDDSTITRVRFPYPQEGVLHGKRVKGQVFLPRESFASLDEAVHWCYVNDSPRGDDPDDYHRQTYDRRYYRIEQAGDSWRVLSSKYARQNVDRDIILFGIQGAE